ncbi:hypothetical protein TCDM_06871 [Trypanosoma cruzi Dm28c]|uniref:Uncharacterized protein n=2 Tax=Trypanosoma cruzi TaxID=5693 RepID=V5BFL6_TRYCR|nr:hypothetical protein TCDM_06871 [Trypanosoma cruzi Dm28c]PWU87321.1 hypothetical protein C4B63_95g52 [Trypanosoma cruzi]
MEVLASDEGGLCALSPNKGLYAFVEKGIVVVFMDYIRRTIGMGSDTPSGGEGVDPLFEDAEFPKHRTGDAVISTHTALDEIHELRWSPDSTLVTLLLAQRRIVEIVSVYGKCCVARIDAGISGMRAVLWHPSSRAVYWLGLLQAHVISLVDSQVMRLAGSVKYSTQLAARKLSSKFFSHGDPNSSLSSRMSDPVSEAALIRFSTCHRFLLYVTPKSLHSPLSKNQEGQAVPSRGLNGDVTPTPPGEPDDNENCASPRPQRSEWLVVASATTHEELHVFPTGSFVRKVSDFIPLECGIALVDYIHGSMALITYNGTAMLQYEPSGVKNVVSSKNGTVLLVIFADACRPVLVQRNRILVLRRISFQEDVILPLKLRELHLLKEPSLAEGFPLVTVSRADESCQQDVDILRELNKCHEWTQGRGMEAFLHGHAEISASGQIAAVTLARWPSWVLLIDILGQRVTEVLRHNEPVVGLCWSPSPSSEYWRFQRRYYMGQNGGTVGADGAGDGAVKGKTIIPGQEEPLLVMTDNHQAKVFFWLANYATCFMASREGCVDEMDARRRRKQRADASCGCEGGFPALRLNRGMFGESAATAVLVDDVRGIALTVAFRMNESNQ